MLHQWPNTKRTTMIFIKVSAALWKLRYSTSFFLNAFTNSTERFRKKTALKKIIIIKKKRNSKRCFWEFGKIQRKTPLSEFLCNRDSGRGVFLWIIQNFLRTPFLQNTSGRLRLFQCSVERFLKMTAEESSKQHNLVFLGCNLTQYWIHFYGLHFYSLLWSSSLCFT